MRGTGNILNKILVDKTIWMIERKKKQPLYTFQKKIKSTKRDFYNSLRSKHTVFILECKKYSPSKGLICKNFDIKTISGIYRQYAAVVSVLTDEKYFKGDFKFLSITSDTITQPVLCKDFIIDPYQIYLARYYKADAILLILSILNDDQYRHLSYVAHSMNMGILTEISNKQELERAIKLEAKVIGINNRDLRDLSIDVDRTRQLSINLKSHVILISESGIYNNIQIRELSSFVNGFLIGSVLMEAENLDYAVRSIILGENKICGLTRSEDAQSAYKAGAIYGGMIFAEDSPRKINHIQAQILMTSAPLKYVCVFQNNSIKEIVTLILLLHPAVVQLHGNEDKFFVAKLRQILPSYIKIWKSFSIIKDHVPIQDWPFVDRYIFDNGQGGTNQCFNWSILRSKKLSNVILAGGLNEFNCLQAVKLGCIGLDLNSGIEISPGIKDSDKITSIFRLLRSY